MGRLSEVMGLLLLLPAAAVRADGDRAAAALTALGGRVVCDGTKPDKPVLEVALDFSRAADKDLVHLRAFGSLEKLDLGFTAVTDEGLKHLRDRTRLRVLKLPRTAVTDRGLAHLAG